MSEPRNSPETRAKISAAVRAKHQDPEYREKLAATRKRKREELEQLRKEVDVLRRELELANRLKWKYSDEADTLRAEIARLRGGTQ